jgi:hypothetical protein
MEELQAYRISNKQVSEFALYVVWDEENEQLVAANIVSTNKQGVESLWASYTTNSKRNISVKYGEYYWEAVTLDNAKKGGVKLARTMNELNVRAYTFNFEHPACGDPRKGEKWEYFYVLATEQENMLPMFIQRLDMAIVWPVLPEWGEYMYAAGIDQGLVKPLSMRGPGYANGVCVTKNTAAWQAIIEAGMVGGHLK